MQIYIFVNKVFMTSMTFSSASQKVFARYFCSCVSKKFQSFDFRLLLFLACSCLALSRLPFAGLVPANGGIIFSDCNVALPRSRLGDKHFEKNYDPRAVTLGLRGDTRLTDAWHRMRASVKASICP